MFVRIRKESLTLLACCISMYAVGPVYASEMSQQEVVAKETVLKDFVSRMRKGYARASAFLDSAGLEERKIDLRGLPDGEILILSFRLRNNYRLEGDVLAEVQNRQIYLSLRDIITVLDFPIEYNSESGDFSGWYIRENRAFKMDGASGKVYSNGTEYNILGHDIIRKEDDVYVSLLSLENWFNLQLEPNVSEQYVRLDADPPLPIMERIARRKFEARADSRRPATLPRGDDGYKMIGFPKVDVSQRTTYRKMENAKAERDHTLNVRTSGEFAYGTLSTSVSANDEDQITNARVTYFQESSEPELLGPLGARRFEVGDIQPARVPIIGSAPPETGVRVTNIDPLVRRSVPSTQISGYIFPGWDVELYRENSLLRFVETDENGYYSFDNVRLFSNRNFFRVVAYGPQGEVREENVNVPYDQNREAGDGAVYDVSVSMQNKQFYNKFDSTDPDRDTPHFVGFFETPLTAGTALRLGARHREENGQQKTYASAGVSSALGGALVNATVAADEDGEVGSEFVLTRQFGPHNFRADLGLASEDFNPGQTSRSVRTFSNRYALEGPFPIKIGDRPRYATNLGYNENASGDHSVEGFVNFNTTHKRLGFNQSLSYNDDSNRVDGALIGSGTSVTGTVGKDTYRVRANYQFKPESELESLFASWRRRISPELESQLEVGHTLENDVSRLSGQLNWRPEYATISPRFSYDSDGNVEGMINTRFGLTRNSDPGEFVFSRDSVTGNGSINAFVFLDKNGNKTFDGEDEPIPDARVLTPQNGGGADTNENGVATISQLRPNIITDVYVEQGSLADPYWIAAAEGVSILPRTGTNVRVEIPIHNSGEIDGTVYAKKPDGGSVALRNVGLRLYSEDGEVEQKTKSGPDGFYLFSLVPPGRYALSVYSGVPKDVRRPRPQFIEIGYDGTTIFGNDILLESGKKDIPNEIIADLDDYRALHPHIDFANNDYKIALNLGAFKSRLMMSFMWYRLQSRYAEILSGTKIYVPPSQSYALPKTGEHILRAGLASEDIDDAYNRCRALVARDLYCKVEIYPTAKKQKFASVEAR